MILDPLRKALAQAEALKRQIENLPHPDEDALASCEANMDEVVHHLRRLLAQDEAEEMRKAKETNAHPAIPTQT